MSACARRLARKAPRPSPATKTSPTIAAPAGVDFASTTRLGRRDQDRGGERRGRGPRRRGGSPRASASRAPRSARAGGAFAGEGLGVGDAAGAVDRRDAQHQPDAPVDAQLSRSPPRSARPCWRGTRRRGRARSGRGARDRARASPPRSPGRRRAAPAPPPPPAARVAARETQEVPARLDETEAQEVAHAKPRRGKAPG